ncbi:MAG: hypothetical protein ACOCUD_03245 [Bacillota bacterium]
MLSANLKGIGTLDEIKSKEVFIMTNEMDVIYNNYVANEKLAAIVFGVLNEQDVVGSGIIN